jgi:hypothetical protein
MSDAYTDIAKQTKKALKQMQEKTMTPAPQYYLIEEKVLDDVAQYAKGTWVDVVRSRPYTSASSDVLEELDKKCYDQISFLSGAGSSERIAYKQVRLWIAERREQMMRTKEREQG